MNKKVMIILVICLVVIIGGALGFWMKTKESNKATPKNAEAAHSSTKDWNPYATEDHHQVTLTDQLLSASGGDYVVKMNITLDFASDEAYYKFKGYKTEKEAKKAEKGSEHGGSEDTATPMELKINDIIGQLLMDANHNQLTDREMLKTYLKDGINRKLDFDKEVIKELYIENLILQ
ncbi:flagellar basal body-associated FliL family protein [Priestia sp. SB1]|uniref:Flagellar protein FliL n=1 Tax=Priestia aryabhattai TaxID=412384 RepID=A0AAX6NCL7_PRIAR|nr:flagellar basal body-associated FliL family protein [Priestia aryabhattai]MDU9693651.1 flagellar basal body-associated FliL family protein [Priestia aryabhattai]